MTKAAEAPASTSTVVDPEAQQEKLGEEKQVKVYVKHAATVRGKTYHRGEQKVPESVARSLGLVGEAELPNSDPAREVKRTENTGGPAVPESAKDKK
jgi:hypothetical protein